VGETRGRAHGAPKSSETLQLPTTAEKGDHALIRLHLAVSALGVAGRSRWEDEPRMVELDLMFDVYKYPFGNRVELLADD
jgi:hypothetical protein